MSAKIISSTVLGIEAILVEVEVRVTPGLKRFSIVGLADSVVKEAKDRVRCAILHSGFEFPNRDVVVSLAPAMIPKAGSNFDLAIALGILAADGQLSTDALHNNIVLGELALDGAIRPCRGLLATSRLATREKINRIVIPRQPLPYETLFPELTFESYDTLTSLVHRLTCASAIGGNNPSIFEAPTTKRPSIHHLSWTSDSRGGHTPENPFDDVIGQEEAKRACEIAAAGGHNLLMIGPPGCGKSMLASRLPSILPTLSRDEFIEVASIYEAANLRFSHRQVDSCIYANRPYREPHHSASLAGLIGGGSIPKPGEISLAHRGVLFLDELAEFKAATLEALRQPLESRRVTISRAKTSLNYPADFILVAAMNPRVTHTFGKRQPTAGGSHQTQHLISGPLMDRLDLQITVPPVDISKLINGGERTSDPDMPNRVMKARIIQRERFQSPWRLNAHITANEVYEFCRISDQGKRMVEKAASRANLSARGISKVFRVARTISDLAGSEAISTESIAEAFSYRIST